LAFARQQSVHPEVLNLNDRVAGMLTLLPRLIGEDIAVHSAAAPALWPVNVDASQIDQILTNLCVNARKAIHGIGSIHIETANCSIDEAFCVDRLHAVPGEFVRLRVRDTGVGMDAQTMAHIFEPFFTTASAGDGVGLGLSTVFGAVVQNRGFIDVVSAPQAGATFDVYLPRFTGVDTITVATEFTSRSEARAGTVLLVEDEPALLQIANKMLASEGFRVIAANGPEHAIALSTASREPIDLLLTDVIMPGMNGRDLANLLRSLRPELRCLFMSGYPADVIATHGVLDPGVSFIQKPFRIAQLSAKVREVLEL
jgi:CheY-like chemotaxis protein